MDTNVIVEAWRVDAWQALRGWYRLEAVEERMIPNLPLGTAYGRDWLDRALIEFAQRDGRIV